MAQPEEGINYQIQEDQLVQLLQAVRGNGQGRKANALEKTDPLEFRTWRDNFETVTAINGWDQLRAKREIKAAMLKEAAALTRDIDIQVDDDDFTADQLLDAYEARFISPAASALAITEFQSAKQEAAETAVKFHSRLRGLFARAYPHHVDGANVNVDLISAFTQKLKHPETMMFCLTQAPATYAAALTLAQQHESALIRRKNASRTFIADIEDPGYEINAVGFDKNKPPTKLRCYYRLCGGPHTIAFCPILEEASKLYHKYEKVRTKISNYRGNAKTSNRNQPRRRPGVNSIDGQEAESGTEDYYHGQYATGQESEN